MRLCGAGPSALLAAKRPAKQSHSAPLRSISWEAKNPARGALLLPVSNPLLAMRGACCHDSPECPACNAFFAGKIAARRALAWPGEAQGASWRSSLLLLLAAPPKQRRLRSASPGVAFMSERQISAQAQRALSGAIRCNADLLMLAAARIQSCSKKALRRWGSGQ